MGESTSIINGELEACSKNQRDLKDLIIKACMEHNRLETTGFGVKGSDKLNCQNSTNKKVTPVEIEKGKEMELSTILAKMKEHKSETSRIEVDKLEQLSNGNEKNDKIKKYRKIPRLVETSYGDR
ncbi:hypothetical protein ACH5RR_015512 [Cinchona calisaya]|uniref:Uncharacterized protein n=1 Tax=Cinchona calisaya TaxID=153742 RepID=A0ABD2ZYR4_9GENT